MIVVPYDKRMNPVTRQDVFLSADKIDGDGVFENTDLVRAPVDGYLLVNALVTATGDSKIYVPQLCHQENRYSNIPVLNAALFPAWDKIPSYKIPVRKGESKRVLYDEVSDTLGLFSGAFYAGRKNPVAMNTPDILVIKQLSADATNVLDDTDLDNPGLPGWLYVWGSSSVQDTRIQIQQAGHNTGNYSLLPTVGSGLGVDCSAYPPYKTYVPATRTPVITIDEVSAATITIVAAFFVDRPKVPDFLKAQYGLWY